MSRAQTITANFAAGAPSADLQVTVNDGKTAAVAGATNTYTIVVSNDGPSYVTGAVLKDTFPTTLTGITFTATQTGGATGFPLSGSGNINNTLTLPPGSAVTYKATGKLNPAATGTLSDTAIVTVPSGITDPNLANNSATDTDNITVSADLKVTVNDGKATAVAGTQDTYTIVVTNVGPSKVTGAVIHDTFPSAFTGVTCTANQSGGASGFSASGSGNINDTITMPPASTITYKATGTISASATSSISDTATVTAPSGVTDPNNANNSATDTDTLKTASKERCNTAGAAALLRSLTFDASPGCHSGGEKVGVKPSKFLSRDLAQMAVGLASERQRAHPVRIIVNYSDPSPTGFFPRASASYPD